MNKRTWSWHSEALGRSMDVACFGDFGLPMLLFPTAGGDFLECERFKMIYVLTPLIEAKRLKVYATGTISGDAWLSREAAPAHKAWLQGRFDAYLHKELIPFIHQDCGGHTELAAAGASLGAFNAVLAGTRTPGAFSLVIGMSGTYLFDRWMNGHIDENFYFCQPLRFLPGLAGPHLDALRKTRFVIATGQGRAEAPHESRMLAEQLQSMGVDARFELWGHDVHHDWPTWRTMLPMFLDRLIP